MATIVNPQPVVLGREAAMHLGAALDIAPLAVTADFWAHRAGNHPAFAEGRLLSVFDYTDTWQYWERHPDGDELVYLLCGAVDLLLERDEQEPAIPMRGGEAAIVPRGAWHRAAIHAPSRMLFITPTPRRTQQRPA